MRLPVVYNEVHVSRPTVRLSVGCFICHRCVASVCGVSIHRNSFSVGPPYAHVQNSDMWFSSAQQARTRPANQFNQFCNISACAECIFILYFPDDFL